MQLRSALPWWLDVRPPEFDFTPLEEDLSVDAVVVGAGVTGALVGHELAASGMSVAILDERDAGRGSTAASTALLLVETDSEFRELASTYGEGAAARVWELGERAIDRIAAIATDLPVPVSFERHPAFYLASDRGGLRRLGAEASARRAAGFEVELVEGEALGSLPHRAALRSRGASVDPYLLTLGVLAATRAMGARIHDRTKVRAWSAHRDGVTIRTDRRTKVRARHVVVAAGYETERFLGLDLGRLRTSFAIVTEPVATANEPVPGWPPGALAWETARPYLYARPLPGGRLLVGGEDTAFAGDPRAASRLARRSRRIARALGRWLPDARIEIGQAWAATFGESRDGLPWIGRVPGESRVWAAAGFGGNGITFAAIAAELLGSALARGSGEDLDLFRFDR